MSCNSQQNSVIIFLLCVEGICKEPGGIPFSTRSRYKGPYKLGSQVIYDCFDGGKGRITCENGGAWNLTWQPTCTGEKSLMYIPPVQMRKPQDNQLHRCIGQITYLCRSLNAPIQGRVVGMIVGCFSRMLRSCKNIHATPSLQMQLPCSGRVHRKENR